MVASWRPDIAVQVAFNANPNESITIRQWSDLSSLWTGADQVRRGRQYELDQNQTAQPAMLWLDPDEYLNPANTGSPYFPDVLPMREILWQALWPNTTAGNLLNANQGTNLILGTDRFGYDPSFESYTVGTTPPWITALGGVTATVTTTTPHTGTKCLTYSTVFADPDFCGVRLTAPTMPGRQYTASAWARQSSGVAPTALTVDGLTYAQDSFNRTVANGWGNAEIGTAWTTSGGSASDYAVTPGFGLHKLNAVNTGHFTINQVGNTLLTEEIVVLVSVDQLAVGAPIRAGTAVRYTTAAGGSGVLATLDFNTDRTITATLSNLLAGTATLITTAAIPAVYSPGQQFAIRLGVAGAKPTMKVWRATDPESLATTLTGSTTVNSVGSVACLSNLQPSNTNGLPVTVSFANVNSTYSKASVPVLTTAGTWTRLVCTFTATQPFHTLTVGNFGTNQNNTILVDDIQLEQGNSATTFITSGPCIYGVFAGNVERWPSEWQNQGFLGYCESTALDGFEALNRYGLTTEYRNAVLTSRPLMTWPLNDSAGATIFGEQSGNGGPPLRLNFGKNGAGSGSVTAGVAINMLGDPSSTAVQLAGGVLAGLSGIGLQAGLKKSGSGFAVGGSGVQWSFSAGLWLSFPLASPAALSVLGVSGPGGVSIGQGVSSGSFWLTSTTGPDLHLLIGFGFTAVNYNLFNAVLLDGKPHFISYTVSFASPNMSVLGYIDGVAQVPAVIDTDVTWATVTPNFIMSAVEVGGAFDSYTQNTGLGAIYSNVTLWDRALTSTEMTGLWNAGSAGNAGETSGTRVARYVATAWAGRTSIDTGASIMGVSTITQNQSVLQACQDVTTTEQGNFWVDKDGQVVFASRLDRYLHTTSLFTFGENTAGGELPYQEGIGFDFDPTLVDNNVTVNNADGVTVSVSDSASQATYFARSLPVNTNLNSDDDAIQLAYWLLNAHDQPSQRIASIQLNPASYPQLWPVILSLEVNDRITVVRRPKAANDGTGIVMVGDFFVEAIEHSAISMANNTWTTTLLLSPASLTSHVWILQDPTWGVLGSTTRLAY